MTSYVVLFRGINVGGKNLVPMAELKLCLEEQGFDDVSTYIQSGNVLLRSALGAAELSAKVNALLPQKFRLDTALVKVLALDAATYRTIVAQAPPGFGGDTDNYRCNVLFLLDARPTDVMAQLKPRDGVDQVTLGDHALYWRHAVAGASKSFLGKLNQVPLHPSITIRNWNTAAKLAELLVKSVG